MRDKKEDRAKDTDRRSLNSHYGNVTGLLQTLSLLLNAGLMIYAHVGLSGVVYSSQPPLAQLKEESATLSGDANIGSTGDANIGSTGDANIGSTGDDNIGSTGDANIGSTGDNNTESVCSEADVNLWIDTGGKESLGTQSSNCSLTQSCFINDECNSICFQGYGYSKSCADCFPLSIRCGFDNCLSECLSGPTSDACTSCSEAKCDPLFFSCTSFPLVIDQNETTTDQNETTTDQNETITDQNETITNQNETITDQNESNSYVIAPGSCNYDLDVDQWYVVYNLTFIGSVRDTWEADVKLLSIIIVIFSGIWPYAKNLIILLAWYIPMSNRMRKNILLWLTRLSKYTLVDVFAVIVLLVATQLDLNVGGTDAVVRSEARFGIIAFLLATVWEFIQIEWTVLKNNRLDLSKHSKDGEEDQHEPAGNDDGQTGDDNGGKTSSVHILIVIVFFILTLGAYISGSALEIFHVETFDQGQGGCFLSYNLATMATALLSEVSLTANTTAWQTWILCISYFFFALILPIVTHLLQMMTLFFLIKNDSKNKMQHKAKTLAGALWGMSCVEVFLIGLFSVEYKFQDFVKAIAGEEDAALFTVKSGLGPGFFILIGYSVVAGLFQYYLHFWLFNDTQQRSAETQYVENLNGPERHAEQLDEPDRHVEQLHEPEPHHDMDEYHV